MVQKIAGFLILCFLLICSHGFGQRNPLGGVSSRLGGLGNMSAGGGGDSLLKRTYREDSITITFRYFDSTRLYFMDTSVNDFTKRYPIPANHLFLGNLGSATRSLTFNPFLKPGFDAGMHAFDVYKFNVEETKFYNTTRPYTELGYVIGSKTEQSIFILHTQNIMPNWNFALQYRMFSAPGFFQYQNTSHNNYRFNSLYQSKDKRYSNYFVILSNQLKAGENGGISKTMDYLSDSRFSDRFAVPVRLGGERANSASLFSSTVNTGNIYSNTGVYMRQMYDWGKKDSLQINDSTTIKLYYPKFRVQHTFHLNTSKYQYRDFEASFDSARLFYQDMYQLASIPDTISIGDQFRDIRNEISLIQFPDSKNQQQFLRVGAMLQNVNAQLRSVKLGFYNIILLGEYRNKTKNQKWDLEANGQLYATGFNAGDYQAHARLKRFLGKKIGNLELGFQNVNRSPSFIFDPRSSFNFTGAGGFNKENITHAYGKIEVPALQLELGGNLYLVGNYMYFSNPYTPAQYGQVFNVVKITADKKFKVGRHWNWYNHVTVQQKAGDAPLNMPLVFTRQRFAFEGLFFKFMNLSTGLELRYNTPFKTDGYSPMLGQFYYQDTTTVNNLPDIAAFFHFRIRTFNAFVRTENLNAATLNPTFGFTNNNTPVPTYVSPGLLIRVGIFWGFVN